MPIEVLGLSILAVFGAYKSLRTKSILPVFNTYRSPRTKSILAVFDAFKNSGTKSILWSFTRYPNPLSMKSNKAISPTTPHAPILQESLVFHSLTLPTLCDMFA